MRAINLYSATRIPTEYRVEFMNVFQNRTEKENVKEYEFLSLRALVEKLTEHGLEIEALDHFFYSYKIPRLGKEMDLLRISIDTKTVLNIELKSGDKPEAEIRKQLLQNRYYLHSFADEIMSYTYVQETNKVLKLMDDELAEADFDELIRAIRSMKATMEDGLDELFEAKNYLISPFDDVEEFLEGKYFLTGNQEEKKRVLTKKLLDDGDMTRFFGITGDAGTGKSLLLYDIVKELASRGKQCLIIHCAILGEGHRLLNDKWENVSILTAKEIGENPDLLQKVGFLFVDECQRIHDDTLELILASTRKNHQKTLFSYDSKQVLSKKEHVRDVAHRLNQIDGYCEERLGNAIRLHPEVLSFCDTLFWTNDRSQTYLDYSRIEILYAADKDEAMNIVGLYEKNSYVFVPYTPAFVESELDFYNENRNERNSHHVIGREFDRVMVMLDDHFYYDKDGVLCCKEHPGEDYLFDRLLKQGLTRTRDRLCILVVGDEELFRRINGIRYQMLERFVFEREIVIGPKKLDKSREKIMKLMRREQDENYEMIRLVTDILNHQINGERNRKILKTEKRLYRMIMEEYDKESELRKAMEVYYKIIDI